MRRADSPASEASRKGRPDALHGLERRQLLVECTVFTRFPPQPEGVLKTLSASAYDATLTCLLYRGRPTSPGEQW
jgi:hypothetical protein